MVVPYSSSYLFCRRELSQETNGTKILTVRAFMGSKISFTLTNLCRCAMGQVFFHLTTLHNIFSCSITQWTSTHVSHIKATADITFRFDPIEHADTILAAYDTSLKRQGLNPQCDDDKITGLPIHKGMARYNFFEDTGKDGGRINEILATVKGEGEQEIRYYRTAISCDLPTINYPPPQSRCFWYSCCSFGTAWWGRKYTCVIIILYDGELLMGSNSFVIQ